MKFLKFLYKIQKIQNYLSKDYNVELRCEKIIQIKGHEKFEKMIRKMISKMIVDLDLIEITFFAQSDRDLIGDHIFPSDR